MRRSSTAPARPPVTATSACETGGSSRSVTSTSRPRKWLMQRGRRSRRASSTYTHITTRSCSGIRPRVRRCSTESPRCSAETVASPWRPPGRTSRTTSPGCWLGLKACHWTRCAPGLTGSGHRSETGSLGSTVGSRSTPDSSSATRRSGWRRWATTRSAATRRRHRSRKWRRCSVTRLPTVLWDCRRRSRTPTTTLTVSPSRRAAHRARNCSRWPRRSASIRALSSRRSSPAACPASPTTTSRY